MVLNLMMILEMVMMILVAIRTPIRIQLTLHVYTPRIEARYRVYLIRRKKVVLLRTAKLKEAKDSILISRVPHKMVKQGKILASRRKTPCRQRL